MPYKKKSFPLVPLLLVLFVIVYPIIETVLPSSFRLSDSFRTIFIFSLLGLGLNIVTGYTGLLNLGCASFMAIGAYTYAIFTCPIYPFQVGFWPGIALSIVAGALSGTLLGLPAIRLRGDYLAVVTLGFGEIIQDLLRNLDVITKGTQGINPLPYPSLFGYQIDNSNRFGWYYLLLGLVALVTLFTKNLENSSIGRTLIAIREDELAARSMGIKIIRSKLMAFATGAALCGLAGALWASYFSSTGEPGNYDFNISIMALCIVIVGGMGSIRGVLLGAFIMVGINSIVLSKLASYLEARGMQSSTNIFSSPGNWKYMIFGFALILMMRWKPEGLWGKKE
jgi:branched-chain amino acid transport system permease protein